MSSSKKYEFFEMKEIASPDTRLEKAIDGVVSVLEKIKKKMDDKSIYSDFKKPFEELSSSISHIQRTIHLIETNDEKIQSSMKTKISDLKSKSNELILWNTFHLQDKKNKLPPEVNDNIRYTTRLIDVLCSTMNSLVDNLPKPKSER